MALTRPRASQINTVITNVTDPLIVLNNGSTVANIDVGLVMNRNNGTLPNVALFWDESANTFATTFTTSTGGTNANVVISEYANVKAGTLFGNLGGGSVLSNIHVTGSLIPTANITFDLGSPTRRWRDGWFSGTTIYIGTESMSVDANGKWAFTSGGTTVELGSNVAFNPPSANISGNISANAVIAGALYTDNFFYANGVAVSFSGSTYSNTQVQAYLTTNQYAVIGNITTANTAMKGYVDGQISSVNSAWQANAAVQAGNIATLFANAAVQAGAIVDAQYTDAKVAAYLPNNTANIQAGNLTVTSLTANRIPFVSTDGLIRTSANLVYQNNGIRIVGTPGSEQLVLEGGNSDIVPAELTISRTATNDTQGSGPAIRFQDNGTVNNIRYFQVGGGNWQFIAYRNNWVEDMRLDSGGNLKIFTNTASTSTSSGALQVAGGAGITGNLWAGNVTATNFTYANGQSILTNVDSALSNLSSTKANLASPSFTGNVNITGNLYVSGNMTVYNTNNVSLTDGMIYLADGNSGNVVDLGMTVAWTDAVRYQHGGFVRDASDGVWKLFGNVVAEPTTTVDFTNATYESIKVGNVNLHSQIVGAAKISMYNSFQGIYLEGGANAVIDLAGNDVTLGQGGTGNTIVYHTGFRLQQSTNNIWSGSNGAGTTTFRGNLTISRNLNLSGNLLAGGVQGADGQLLQATDTGVAWVTLAPSNTITDEDDTSVSAIQAFVNVTVNSTQVAQFTSDKLSVTGNVQANYFIGDGSLLTGISGGGYGNTEVAAYLPTYNGNVANLTLNPSATIFAGNATANITIGSSTWGPDPQNQKITIGGVGQKIYFNGNSSQYSYMDDDEFYIYDGKNNATAYYKANQFALNRNDYTAYFDAGPGTLTIGAYVGNDRSFVANLNMVTWGNSTVRTTIGNTGITTSDISATNINVTATTTSTSSTTGALRVSGGIGVAGNVFTGGIVDITSTAASTSTSTGALIVDGGAGIVGNVVSGANVVAAHQIRVNSSNFAVAIVNSGTNGVGNIGASGAGFNTVFARATSAQYADLAEIYTSDREYVPGTVLIFGGEREVTVSTLSHDPRVAGVVSTNPAYIMNNSCDGVEVALQGRVPTKVQGPVAKGDRLVTSSVQGAAERLDMSKYQPGCIIGKALEDIADDSIQTIEVVVGRV